MCNAYADVAPPSQHRSRVAYAAGGEAAFAAPRSHQVPASKLFRLRVTRKVILMRSPEF